MTIYKQGLQTAKIKWNIVRGDTASLRIDFLEKDEETIWDTSGWSYEASSYYELEDSLESLEIEEGSGYVIITAPADLTETWGQGFESLVAEVKFDLKVTMEDDTVWTPVIGNIVVSGNVSGDF